MDLLAELTTASWESFQRQLDPEHRNTHIFTSVSSHLLLYTVTPEPLPAENVGNAVSFLLKVKPINHLKNGLRIISNSQAPLYSGHEHDLLHSIDTSIEIIIQYFSASNWNEVYPKVHSLLKSTVSSKSDEAEMLPGIEILASLYLDAPKAHGLLEDVYTIIPQIKRPIHRYTIEYFLQKGLVYWMFARPREFVFESQNDTPLSQIASALFDVIYASNNDDRRRQSTWNLLGLLISFMPSAFSDLENSKTSKSKVKSSFKLHSNKKQSYLTAIATMIASSQSQVNDIIIAATKHIIKAGSILYILAPNSPIVSYSKNLYSVLLPHLFASPARSSHVVNLPLFQSTFVSAFSVLNPQGLLTDVYPMIKAKDEFMFYTPNILQGHINLRQINIFSKYYTYMMDQLFDLLRLTITETTGQLRFFESQSNFSTELFRSKIYGNYVATISKGYTIFSFDPIYFIKNYEHIENYNDDLVFRALADSSLSINPIIEQQAIDFILNFLKHDVFDKFQLIEFPGNPAVFVYRQCFNMAKSHAERILEYENDGEFVTKHLKLVKAILESRADLIQTYELDEVCSRDPTKLEPEEDRRSVSRLLETTMYVSLCSSNTETCKLALGVLNCLVHEAVLIEDLSNMANSSWSIVPNFAMHSEFSSSSYVLTGSVAVQKRLYHFLQRVEMATPAILSAWNIIVVRWRALTRSIIADSSTNREMIKQWRSYSGFLCSVISPQLTQEENPNGDLSQNSKDFLTEMIELLTLVKSPFLRETARDVLSRDSSHLSYHFIFKVLENKIALRLRAGTSSSTLVEEDFLLLEQSVMYLKSVIVLINEGDMLMSVDIGTLSLTIARCLDSLIPDDRVLRMRILYSHLFELIASQKDTLNMKHDLTIRNEITDIFANWLDRCLSFSFNDDTESQISSNASTNRSHRKACDNKDRLVKDCIYSLLQAFTVILVDLRIEPHDSVHDITEARAQKFSTLFSLFIRVLERCRQEELGDGAGSIGLGERLAVTKSNAIDCASKLLNYNLDVGLKFALPLGFRDDFFIRTSFIKILDSILTHGSKEAVEATEFQRFQELAEFMTQNISITLSLCDLCPATEVDEFSKALMNIFDAKAKCLKLVKAVVTREVEKADAPLEILRRNCVATKVLSLYAHKKGLPYLRLSLGPFINDLIADPEPYVFESNPDKIPEGESPEANFVRFERTLNKLISMFQATVGDVPRELRDICKTISTTAGPKFAGAKDNSVTAISSFFFLRFICPALVSPEAIGLLEGPPPKNIRRTLLILAKIIQNMAFGSTSFVKLSIFKLHPSSYGPNSTLIMSFLKGLAVLEDHFDDKSSVASIHTRMTERTDIDVLHKFLYNHWDDINHKMILEQRLKNVQLNGPRNSLVDARRSTIGSEAEEAELRASQKLTSLIRNLGRPRSLKQHIQPAAEPAVNVQDAPRLQELLNKCANKDMGPVIGRRIVNEGLSKDGMPLLILTCRNFIKGEVDVELMLCRYFQIASKLWKKKFAILYDVTGYSPANAFPTSARSVSDLMVPEEMVKNCVGFYFLNVSTEYLSTLKSMIRHYYSGIFLNPTRVQYEFLTTADIPKRFNMNTVNLDPRTMKVNNDVRIIFNNVYRYNAIRNDMTQVAIKLGNEYVQIRAQEPFTYIKTSPGYSNDIFHLSEIATVFSSNSNGHPDEFTIQLARPDEKKIILHCSKSSEIVRAILNAKTRLQPDAEGTAVISPETSLPSLLNIAFSGLCSGESDTQEASYNLLTSLQKRFNLDLGMTIHSGKGLRLPANVFARVKLFSKSVAVAHPELTLDMFNYIFEAFEITSADRRQGVLMYALPWVENLGEHVVTLNTDISNKAIARVIRKFLDISITGKNDYMFLLQSVWPLMLKYPDLVPVVISEIVYLLLDNGFQSGSQLDDIVSILTTNPSIDVCQVVLDNINEMASLKNETGSSLVQHSKWNELVIHITILSAIVFENPKCVDLFFVDLAFNLVMFLYTGPYWFRQRVYNLAVNMIHSSLYGGSCDEENKNHIYTIWKELTGSKGNMIFGISEEMRYIDYDYPVTSLMFQIQSCSVIVSDLANAIKTQKKVIEFISEYVNKALEMASQNSSVFQSRAIVIMACAAHVDVSDDNVSKLLDIFSNVVNSLIDESSREEIMTCLTFCLAKIADGLRVDSKYMPLLFWLAVSLLGSNRTSVLNHALQLLHATLKNLDEYGAFKNTTIAEYLLSNRDSFKREWVQLESIAKASFTVEYFEVEMTGVLMKGLVKSSTRAATLAVFEVLLSLSARNHAPVRENDGLDSGSLRGRNNSSVSLPQHHVAVLTAAAMNHPLDDDVVTVSSGSLHYTTHGTDFPSYMPYLVILFIWSRNTTELKDYLWIAGYPEEQIDGDIPYQIKAFLSSDKPMALISGYICAVLFRLCENEDILDLRVLSCLLHLGSVNTDHFFKIYFVVRSKIQAIVDSGPNLTILKSALDVAKCALSHLDDLSRKSAYIRDMDNVLNKAGLNIISHANDYGAKAHVREEGLNALAELIRKFISYEPENSTKPPMSHPTLPPATITEGFTF